VFVSTGTLEGARFMACRSAACLSFLLAPANGRTEVDKDTRPEDPAEIREQSIGYRVADADEVRIVHPGTEDDVTRLLCTYRW